MSDPSREHMLRQMREMEAILPQVEAELLRYPNVEAVTVGAKERAGVATPQLAFQVYVRVKKDLAELAPGDRVPERVRGFPTDVILLEEPQLIEDTDDYRPLLGGTQLVQGSHTGTLGLIAIAMPGSAAPAGDPVILTNSHVTPDVGSLVGQPSSPSDCWCCACCDVGRTVDSQVTNRVDAAISTLNDDMRYSHEIVDVGAVRGWVSATTLVPGVDQLVKRGRTSERTTGTLSTANAPAFTVAGHGTFDHQIRITAPAAFARPGDSGSVVVDVQNRVVGLVFVSLPPAWTTSHANRIEDVMSALSITIPTLGTAGAVPLSATGGARSAATDRSAAFAALERRARSIDAARAWWALVERHRAEVGDLVRSHRPVTLAWQRYRGPAFLSQYMKTAVEVGHLAAEEIDGMRPQNALLGMAAILEQHGSPALAADIRAHYLDVLRLTRGCRRIDHLLDRLEHRSGARAGAAAAHDPAGDGVGAGAARATRETERAHA